MPKAISSPKPSDRSSLPLVAVGVAGLIGFAVLYGAALLAKDVTLAPLLLLGAPVVLAGAALKLSSPVAAGLVGAALYATYATAVIAPQHAGARIIAAAVVVMIHVASILALNLIPLLFGL